MRAPAKVGRAVPASRLRVGRAVPASRLKVGRAVPASRLRVGRAVPASRRSGCGLFRGDPGVSEKGLCLGAGPATYPAP